MIKSTNTHKKFWEKRKINWEQDYLLADGALNHPHRQMIIDALSKLQFTSVLEVGMGAGANLVRIKQQWPASEVGGFDVNLDAVKVAGKYLPSAKYMDVGEASDIFLSDKSVDVILSDACLIYTDPTKIRGTLLELKRVARHYVILCEFHHESFWKRLKLRLTSGYHAYNYEKLLDELDFFDIQITKIPKEVWSGTPWEEFGNIIVCRTG